MDAEKKKDFIAAIESETELQFNKRDIDRKGYLESDDAQSLLQCVLDQFDTDFQKLELDEKAKGVERVFDHMDSDKVGKVSFRELKATIIRIYSKKMPAGILD